MDLMESAEALRLRASATGLTLLSGAVMMAAGYVGGTESWLAAGFITVPGGLVILAAFALIRRADRADNRAVASSRSYRGSRIAAAVATLLSGGVMGRGTRDGGRSAVTVDLVQVRSPTVGKQGEDDDAVLSFVRSRGIYQAVVRRLTVEAFERLGRGDWRSLVDRMALDVHHVFPGDHPLGGERHTRTAAARWFERLDHLFPGHEFAVRRVVARGWPWSTWVAVQWTARLRPRTGEPYVNEGAHWVHLRWGKVTYFHAYLDTQLVAEACRRMAAEGVEDAAAPAIAD